MCFKYKTFPSFQNLKSALGYENVWSSYVIE